LSDTVHNGGVHVASNAQALIHIAAVVVALLLVLLLS
jgi:hypothetical protein